MKVICISGKARHGKDISGNMFSDELKSRGYRVLVTHYGDKVKFICKNYFGWNGLKDEEGRSLLQHVGTDIVRQQEENYWVDEVGQILYFFQNEWDYVIIPDARFPNEVYRLADVWNLDVTHVRVYRDNFESDLTPEQLLHASETALDDVDPDFKLHNTTLEELREQVIRLCDAIE